MNGHWAMTSGARRAVAGLLVIFIGFAAIVILYTAANTQRLTREVRSQCRFDGDLAGVPITLNPATHQASKLGVEIISDSRVAWHQAGCPGRLAPPSPSFTRWARFYRLPTG